MDSLTEDIEQDWVVTVAHSHEVYFVKEFVPPLPTSGCVAPKEMVICLVRCVARRTTTWVCRLVAVGDNTSWCNAMCMLNENKAMMVVLSDQPMM